MKIWSYQEQANDMVASGKKFFWSAIDRFVFIGVGVLGAVATSYITGLLRINPPELIASPSYNHVDDSRPVPGAVGGLNLDYEKEAAPRYGVLRVDIANEGRGPAAKVRFQVKLPQELYATYAVEPDFKVYSPSSMSFDKNEFYAEMGSFPSNAHDLVAFKIEGDEKLLGSLRIKLVNDDYEGEVGEIKGIE